jgi:hypothetical protein
MKRINILCILSLTIWVTSCIVEDYAKSYEATVQIVNMDGKPLANHPIQFSNTTSSSYNLGTTKVTQELLTNTEGKATFNYELTISDSHQDFATFVGKDDSIWKSISYAQHVRGDNKPKNINFQIKMDSLKPLKIRLSSNRNDLIRYGFRAELEYTSSNKLVVRNLAYVANEGSAFSLDTTFTIKVFSKNYYKLSATAIYNSEPKIVIQSPTFTENISRDTVYWIKF